MDQFLSYADTDENEVHRLEHIDHIVSQIVEACALIGSIAVLIATYTVIFLAIKRKTWKDLPVKISAALIFYALHAPGTVIYYAMGLYRSNWDI